MVLTLLGEPVAYAIIKEQAGRGPHSRVETGQLEYFRPAAFSQHPPTIIFSSELRGQKRIVPTSSYAVKLFFGSLLVRYDRVAAW
jgi:hypothetical protein